MSEQPEITPADAKRMTAELLDRWDADEVGWAEICATEDGKGTYGCARYEANQEARELIRAMGETHSGRLVLWLAARMASIQR